MDVSIAATMLLEPFGKVDRFTDIALTVGEFEKVVADATCTGLVEIPYDRHRGRLHRGRKTRSPQPTYRSSALERQSLPEPAVAQVPVGRPEEPTAGSSHPLNATVSPMFRHPA
jgi:hypothetical protein